MPRKKSWIEVSSPVRSESVSGVYSATYTLSELTRRGVFSAKEMEEFQHSTKLEDMHWRAYWSRGDVIVAGGRGSFPSKQDAVVVFMHGWDGSEAIWEKLPAQTCGAEQNTLVLVPDVNGFGNSPFSKPEQLAYADCDPAANMYAVETLLEMLGILGGQRHNSIVFVGHSMSGAALFYFRKRHWENHIVGRCALAPALLMNDILRKGFYRAMGVGIWAGQSMQLEGLTELISPLIITKLIAGASQAVQDTHKRIFKSTHKSTTAHTFFAMGQAARPSSGEDWGQFKIILGHVDRLVGVTPMLNLLFELGFNSRQVRVVFGDHYFFSVSRQSIRPHDEGREIALEEILDMVRRCRR